MNWDSAAQFLAMGGKAFYVWGSYLVAAVVIALEIWSLRRRRRTWRIRVSRKVTSNRMSK
ncbi:MAG TPA: heme exporter protein CcmD [Burkholderiales bacterium]|nr:heme exporter protein CcmD [Burkholderiales bacterium]